MRLWLVDPGARRAVEVAPGAGVKDLVAVTATTLELRADQVELLFSDVVMPGGMNGFDLAQAALSMKPGLKVDLESFQLSTN